MYTTENSKEDFPSINDIYWAFLEDLHRMADRDLGKFHWGHGGGASNEAGLRVYDQLSCRHVHAQEMLLNVISKEKKI